MASDLDSVGETINEQMRNSCELAKQPQMVFEVILSTINREYRWRTMKLILSARLKKTKLRYRQKLEMELTAGQQEIGPCYPCLDRHKTIDPVGGNN